jgi:hypothetical protein
MAGCGIPDHVRRFVAANIDSVGMLEILLLVRDHRDRGWTAADVARELRSSNEAATDRLAGLRARGLLSDDAGETRSFQYAPLRPDLEKAVDDLASCYATRRVGVISLIYSKPSDRVFTVGDAFRIRRPPR